MREIEDDFIPARSPSFPYVLIIPLFLQLPIPFLLALSLPSLNPLLRPPCHPPPSLPNLPPPTPTATATSPPQPRRIDTILNPDTFTFQIGNRLSRLWIFAQDVCAGVESCRENVAAAMVGVDGACEGEVAFADEEDAVVRVEGNRWGLVLLLLVVGFGFGL